MPAHSCRKQCKMFTNFVYVSRCFRHLMCRVKIDVHKSSVASGKTEFLNRIEAFKMTNRMRKVMNRTAAKPTWMHERSSLGILFCVNHMVQGFRSQFSVATQRKGIILGIFFYILSLEIHSINWLIVCNFPWMNKIGIVSHFVIGLQQSKGCLPFLTSPNCSNSISSTIKQVEWNTNDDELHYECK